MNLLELDGAKCTAVIKDKFADCVIHVEQELCAKAVYLLQDVIEGVPCKEKSMFKYSFFAGYGSIKQAELCDVINIKVIEPKSDNNVILKAPIIDTPF